MQFDIVLSMPQVAPVSYIIATAVVGFVSLPIEGIDQFVLSPMMLILHRLLDQLIQLLSELPAKVDVLGEYLPSERLACSELNYSPIVGDCRISFRCVSSVVVESSCSIDSLHPTVEGIWWNIRTREVSCIGNL